MTENEITQPESPLEKKRREDRQRKREQRKRERETKTQAAQEQQARLTSEQAKEDAERIRQERFAFIKSELTPPILPAPDDDPDYWVGVEQEISDYLAGLGFANDFERLFKYLSMALPELLTYRGVPPLSRDEWMDLEWIRHGFNGPCPSSHEPPNPLSVQRGKGDQQEFQNVYRERIAEGKRIWNSRQSGCRQPKTEIVTTALSVEEKQ